MRLSRKISSAIRDPAMLTAYLRWCGNRIVRRKAPIRISEEVELNEWLSFTEYWSFQELITPGERALVRHACESTSKKSVFVDVGANIGAFTCYMASLGKEVHSFEPVPETFCRLKANVLNNRLMHYARLNCLAISNQSGLVPSAIDDRAPATNRIVTNGRLSGTQLVASLSLDQYCEAQEIDEVSLLKIDVEGLEPYVLMGADKLLVEKKVSFILVEVCPTNLCEAGFSPYHLYSEVINRGYSPHRLNSDGTLGHRLSLEDLRAIVLDNIVLVASRDVGNSL